jgi:single-strand DNA-binding protein
MYSLNKHSIIGHLGKDPEVTYSAAGTAVAKFSVATNYRQKDAAGEYQDQTDWHNIVAFKRNAEFAGQYLKKGDKVYVEGPNRTRSWDDKATGQKKYMSELIANELIPLGGAKESTAKPSSGIDKLKDDDIPF